MTVSDDRRTAVDFTVPFMTFGSEILMKKPLEANDGSTQVPPLPTISSIRDLAGQTVIKYGVIKDGRTADFFRKSPDPDYKQMWDEMSKNPNYGTVPSTEVGVEMVRKADGRYAFITEGTTADYWVHQKPCDLVSVKGKMDTRQYALAVRRGNSELKAKIDEALTQMKDDGELDQLHRKWWIEKSECGGATSFISTGSLVIVLPTALMALAFPLLYGSP